MEKIDLFGFNNNINTQSSYKKIAVLKLGARISINSVTTSGGTGETLSIIKILTDAGYSVDAYTKVLKGDLIPDYFNIIDIESNYLTINDKCYDALIVLNGNVNYFGGKDVPSQTLNYHIINNFKGKVFYILCDCKLFLKQIWNSVESKGFPYNKEDIYISRDDIIYISQPRNVKETLSIAKKYVNIKDCIHFPFEKFPLLTSKFLNFNNNPKYDLLYGGTFRGGSRERDMIEFYFGYGSEYNVSMFGNISIDNFNSALINNLSYPNFENAIPYDLFIRKMNESIATVIIGDVIYKKLDDLAQRIYESLLSGTVILLDSSYDYNKRVFKNNILRELCYVSSSSDVKTALDKLKNNNYRKYIVDLQRSDISFDKESYCSDLKSIIEKGK